MDKMKNRVHTHTPSDAALIILEWAREKRNVNTNMSASKRFNGKSECLFKAHNNTALLLRLCLNVILYTRFPTLTFLYINSLIFFF